MLKRLLAYLLPRSVFPIPAGITADRPGIYGLIGMAAGVNAALPNVVQTLSSANVALRATAEQFIAGVLAFTGSPGGGVTFTTPTGPEILSFFGPSVQTDGTFASRVRLENASGQTITLSGSTGVVTSGTLTIVDGSYRDFLVLANTNSTVTVRNIGCGST